MFENSTRRQQVILLCVFLLGLILRLILVGYAARFPERYIQADAVGYDQLAINLASGHGFSMEVNPPYISDNFRTPGYPATIAFIYTLFGYHPELILWLQAFMGAFTILLVYWLAALIINPNTGLIAAALLAVSPHSITYSALLWSDTEYTLLFTLSIILTLLMLINNNYKWILLSSFLSGVVVLVHPRSIYLPIFFALLLMGVMLQRRIPLRKISVHVGVYILVFCLILIPWQLRNYVIFNVPNITTAAGINILNYGAALTESARTGENQWSIADRYNDEVRGMSSRTLNQAEFAEIAFQLGFNKILHDPITFVKIQIIGMAKVFLPGSSQINTLLTGRNSLDTSEIYSLFTTGQNLQNGAINKSLTELSTFVWGIIGFEFVYLCCVYFFSFYAIIKQNRSRLWLWFFMIVLLYLTVVAGPAGSPRFRVVMMPLLSVTAACGFISINQISRWMDQLCKSQS